MNGSLPSGKALGTTRPEMLKGSLTKALECFAQVGFQDDAGAVALVYGQGSRRKTNKAAGLLLDAMFDLRIDIECSFTEDELDVIGATPFTQKQGIIRLWDDLEYLVNRDWPFLGVDGPSIG